MTAGSDSELEIGHVLFMDIVGYSKLLVDEQEQATARLNEIVRGTAQFRAAEAAGKLMRLPTGDGMVLAFSASPEAPVRCAVEIAKALQNGGGLPMRIGIHSGPVKQVTDVDGRMNLAGGGINIAQRVMDCGDAGHILLSRRAAEDLEQHSKWRDQLHELGECEVKHGVKIGLVNLYNKEIGNSARPSKLKRPAAHSRRRAKNFILAAMILLVATIVGLLWWTQRGGGAGGAFPEKSVAILPFKPLVASSRDEALEAGMADTLITKLSSSREIVVPSLAVTRKYDGKDAAAIGHDLHVNCVLEGSVQKEGDFIRVTARLLNAAGGPPLWADTFDEKFTSVFDVQDRIAQKVADKLSLALNREEKERLTKRYTQNTAAYELYLKGRLHWNRYTEPDWRKSIEYFNQALALDRNYALAYSGLADSYSLLGEMAYAPAHDTFPYARVNAQKALALDEKLASAHLSLAIVKLFYEWDFAGAGEHLRRARELDPQNAQVYHFNGHYFELTKKFEEAIEETKRGISLDPTNLVVNAELGFAYYLGRQPDGAIAAAHKTLQIDQTFAYAAWVAVQAYESKGMYQEALSEIDRALPGSENWSWLVADKGYVFALQGQREAALKIVAELRQRGDTEYIDSVLCAYIYIALGDKDAAFALLEKAVEDRSGFIGWIEIEPKFDPLRSDPRYAALLKRMGLR